MEKLHIKTSKKNELVNISPQISSAIQRSEVQNGICMLFCPHTTAGLTINEGFDPSVKDDIIYSMKKISPDYREFRHSEGNSDGHVKTTLTGNSLTIFIENGKIMLGQWQSIYFAEFDGPRSREIWIKFLSE